jgi:hypothetical protein
MVPTNVGPSRSRNSASLASATRLVILAFSDAAARCVNVKATIAQGSTPSTTSEATRREIDSVLPEPAHATTCRWPPR